MAWGNKKRKTPKPPERLRVWEYKVSKGEACLAPARDLVRQVYNAAIQQRREAWKNQHKSLSRGDQQRELTALRAAEPALAALSCTMLRLNTTTRVDLAFAKFFAGLKPGATKVGYPRYKGRSQFTTLAFESGGWHFEGPWLVLDGIGRLRVSLYRPLPTGPKGPSGVIRGLRVVERAGRTWVQFVVNELQFDAATQAALAARRKRAGRAVTAPPTARVGIDVGCRTFATLSSVGDDGQRVESTIPHPKFLPAALAALKAAQRAVSTKQRGSRRRQLAKDRLTRLSARIANRRRNFLHVETRKLVDTYAHITIEDLDLAEMVTSTPVDAAGKPFMSPAGRRGLHRAIMDSAFGTFRHMLTYKAESAGTCELAACVARGTSQRCSGCGTVVKKDLRVRVHACPVCGLVLGRDENSARIIYDLGCRSAAATASAVGDAAAAEVPPPERVCSG